MPVCLFMWPERCKGSFILFQPKLTFRRLGIGFSNLRRVCLCHTSARLEKKRDRNRRRSLGIPKSRSKVNAYSGEH